MTTLLLLVLLVLTLLPLPLPLTRQTVEKNPLQIDLSPPASVRDDEEIL